METSTINTEYLDIALASIDERLHHEKLMELVPSIKAQNEQNKLIVATMHRLAAIFQKHTMTIFVDEETGLTHDGYDPELASEECNAAIVAIRELAVRFQ